MRKAVAFLLLFALLLLPGCGNRAPKDDRPLTLNPDGTLGNLRWGMRYAEAVNADSRIRLGTSDDPNLNICEVEFLGKRWTLSLTFGPPATMAGYVGDGVSRLGRMTLSPLEEGSWEELVEPLEAVLGPRNITARYVGPEWDEEGRFTCSSHEGLPKWAWAWESAETMGSRLTDRELAAAYPYAEDLNALRWGTPLFTVYFQYRDARDNWYSYQNLQPTHLPAVPETELEDLCSRAEEALTLMRTKTAWSWTSSETLGDRASREVIEEIFKGREELTGNLDGYVYMQRNLLFPLYFRWREWDEAKDGPEPYLVFSIPKGS